MYNNEEWSGPRVAAALARLEDAGYSQSRTGRLAGVGQSTISRWGKGKVRPGYDAVRRLAVAVWRPHPDVARELVEASGYPWQEPSEQSLPPPDPLADLLGSAADADEVRAKIRRRKGADADWYISALEDALRPPAEDAGDPPEHGTGQARR